jgi:hypothetical protein
MLQDLVAYGLTATSRAYEHDAESHVEGVEELNDFAVERLVLLKL